MAATATSTATTTSSAVSPASIPMSVPQAPSMDRRQRLSVSHANALENFSELQAHFQNRRLVVFLDYDGTLTPIVSDPASALLAPAMRDTINKLREKFITGVISGRSLDKIQKFVGIPQLYYAGSHGFDIAGPNGTSIKNQVAADYLDDLHQVRDGLAARIAGIPMADVEDNIFSVSMHYRNVDPKYHEKIAEIAHTVAAEHPNIRCNQGKMVFEYKPKIDWNKGKALVWLLQALGLDQHDDVFTIYIGDDTTDEDAFDVFRSATNRNGVGIIVTEHSTSTGAYFTLHDTNEVCQFLNKLVTHAKAKESQTPSTRNALPFRDRRAITIIDTPRENADARGPLSGFATRCDCVAVSPFAYWSSAGARSAAPAVWMQRRSFATNEFVAHDSLETAVGPLGLLGMDIQARDHISLKWSDAHVSRFHLMHLRSWCLCSECQHETGQRLVNSSDIDSNLEIEDIFIKGSTLNIVWAGDGHKSTFPWSWLRENCYSDAALNQNAQDLATTALAPGAPIPTTEYAKLMDLEDDEGLFQLLHQVVENGLAVVQNTPLEHGQVKKIAERIAPVSHSFLYGDIFDVIAEQNPVNIAYTTHHLKHHLDLAYYESPPGFQFLHALRFDETVQGGESTFVDVFAVASEFRRLHPTHFETLCRVPATFKKHHLNRSNPAIMEYQRPHIQLNHREEVVAVHWSPPFEGPLKVPFDDVQPYYEAYKIFHDIVESGKHKVEFKLKQGDTVVFNQRRVLHGRNQFTADSNGVRHLQGTYLNIDDALCRFNALRYRFAADMPAIKNRRVANGNFA